MNTLSKISLISISALIMAACATGPQLSPEELELQKTSYSNAVKLMRKKRYEKAHTMLQEIHSQQPDKAGPLLNLAIAQAKLKRYPEAIQTFERALDQDPVNAADRANAYNQLGIIYSDSSQLGEAEDMFEDALDEDPNYADAWFNLGLLYDQKLQRPTEAVSAWQNYLKLNGKASDIVGLWIQQIQLQMAAPKVSASNSEVNADTTSTSNEQPNNEDAP